ncbi:MAG TPA: hypothetical protein PK027_03165 [Aquimonas sp.]|nr:hypothetical protein [Aquimonas sp.]HRF53447.1 hypothetical protein [Aquimonas sp.]
MNHDKMPRLHRASPLASLIAIALFNPVMAADIEFPSTPFEPNAQATVEAIERGLQSNDAFRWMSAAQHLSLLLDREGPAAITFQRVLIAHQGPLTSALAEASNTDAAQSLTTRLKTLAGGPATALKGTAVEGESDSFSSELDPSTQSGWLSLPTRSDRIYTVQVPECHGGALAMLSDAKGAAAGVESVDAGTSGLLTFAGKDQAEIRLRLYPSAQCVGSQTLTWSAFPTSGLLTPNTAAQAHVIEPDRDYRVIATPSAGVWVRFADKQAGTYTLETSKLPAGVDTILSAYSADNLNEAAASDDDSAGELASRLQYVSFGRNPMLYQATLLSGSGVFTLRASREQTPTLTVSDEAQPMRFTGGDVIWRRLAVKAGTAYRIRTSASGEDSIDTLLAVYDGSSATAIAENDDNDGDLYASLDYFASEDGEIIVSVRELSGGAGAFALQVSELVESGACPPGNVCFKQPKGD